MIKTLFAILTAFVFLFVLTGKVPSSADDLVTQFNHNTLTLAVLAIGSFVIYSLLLGPSKKARKNTTAAPRRKLTAAEAAQQITDYDFDAASQQREFDRVHAPTESFGLLKWPGTVIGTLRREDMYDDVC